jgi:hypothetical protein
MLRVAAKRTTIQCLKTIQQSVRHESTRASAPRSGSFGRKLFGLTLFTGVAAASTIGYAYKDPEFRKTVESYIPPAKELFNSIIGPAE